MMSLQFEHILPHNCIYIKNFMIMTVFIHHIVNIDKLYSCTCVSEGAEFAKDHSSKCFITT